MERVHTKEYTITEVTNSPVGVPSIEGKEASKSGPTLLDYAGSAEKTDPKEIKLVRKLDLWMLVRAEPLLKSSFQNLVSSLTMAGGRSRCSGSSTS